MFSFISKLPFFNAQQSVTINQEGTINQNKIPFEKMVEYSLQSHHLEVDFTVHDDFSFKKKGTLSKCWSGLKAYFGWRKERSETLENVKKAFQKHWKSKFPDNPNVPFFPKHNSEANKDSAPVSSVSEKPSRSEGVQKIFTDFQSGKKTTTHLVRTLYKEFLLEKIQREKEMTEVPTFIKKSDGKILLIHKAPPIENLVIAGGGARGAAYVGVCRALESTKELQGIKAFAGSSAGAVTAAMLAVGMNAEALDNASQSIDLSSILTKSSSNPELKKVLDLKGSGFSGSYGMEVLNREMNNSIAMILKKKGREYEDTLNPANNQTSTDPKTISSLSQDYAAFRILQEKLSTPQSRSHYFITFKELDLLNRIDPQKFKKLYLTGFERETQKTLHFNVKETPEMTIIQAVRASMALPGVFQKVVINGKEVIDGGMASKYPVEVFSSSVQKQLSDWKDQAKSPDSTSLLRLPTESLEGSSPKANSSLENGNSGVGRGSETDSETGSDPSSKSLGKESEDRSLLPEEARKNAQTMVLAFDKKGLVPNILFNGKIKKKGGFVDRFAARFLKISDLVADQSVDRKKLWEMGPQVRNVFHGKLGTVTFFAGESAVAAAQEQAEIKMLEQLLDHQHEGIAEEFTNFNDAWNALSKEEKRAYQAGLPNRKKALEENIKESENKVTKTAEEEKKDLLEKINYLNQELAAVVEVEKLLSGGREIF